MTSKQDRFYKRRLRKRMRIRPGDIYEDCSYHPCVCLGAASRGWGGGWRRWLGLRMDIDLTGISLWDLSIRGCSARHCAPVPLKPVELLKSLYYHHEDEQLLKNPDLRESIEQMKAGMVAAEYIPGPHSSLEERFDHTEEAEGSIPPEATKGEEAQ